jgi:hypothetical protein
MPTEHQEVLSLAEEIGRRRVFPRSAGLDARLFNHLAKHWSAMGNDHLKVAAIANEVLTVELDRKSKGKVRQAIHRLRVHLDEFYVKGAGRKLPRRLQLPMGVPYVLEIVPNDDAFDPLEEFWDSYFSGDYQNVVVWAEPLVFFDQASRAYVRFLDQNCEEADPNKVNAMVPPLDHPLARVGMVPCFHYQSSGDIAAVHLIQSWFVRKEAEITPCVTRDPRGLDVVEVNAIVLGNQRTNRYVKELQRGLDFIVDAESVRIENPDLSLDEKPEYADYRPSEALNTGGSEGFAYAVLTRRPNLNDRASATIIAANHGRAIHKVAEYLISRKRLTQLFDDKMRVSHRIWPETFQVLFKVRIVRGMVFQDAEVVTCRVYPSKTQA